MTSPVPHPAAQPAPESLHATTAADLLAYIPHRFSFAPKNSLVALTVHGTTVRAGIRVDLPQGAPPGGSWLGDYAQSFVAKVCCDRGADGVLLALYAPADWLEPGEVPYEPLLNALSLELHAANLQLRDAWYVGPNYWRTLTCADPECCPWPGEPVSRIAGSVLAAELIFRGSSFDEDVDQSVRNTVAPKPGPARADFDACAGGQRSPAGSGKLGAGQFRAILEAWEWALFRGDLPAPHAAFLAASLASTTVRDSVLVLCSVGPRLAFAGARAEGVVLPETGKTRAAVRPPDWPPPLAELSAVRGAFRGSPEAPVAEFATVLIGRSGAAPDWGRTERALQVLRQVAALSSGAPRAAALTMMGWMEWVKGRGLRAGAFLHLALEEEPDYRLARLLDEVLGRGILCRWAQDERLAWRGQAARP